MKLDDTEQAMLAGEAGPAPRLAMRVLARLAPVYGADRLLPVTRAHIDGCIYAGRAGLDYAERLAGLDARVSVPTSLNVVSLDRVHWRRLGIPEPYADRARRLAEAYLAMGARPTFTCAPYQTDAAPAFGEQIAWSESNAVAFANSVIGARTNRYGDYLDIACAIVGRVPAAGLHLDEPRLGTLMLDLGPLPPGLVERDDFWPVLGYLIGALAGEEVPVVRGLDARPSDDQLKSLAAAAATSGSVALFHLVGITPEAATEAEACGGRPPHSVQTVTLDDLRRTRADLRTARTDGVDLVAFGSPHCSLAECRTIASLVSGRRAAAEVRVFVTTSRAVRDLLARSGDLATLEAFGASVVADTCIVVSPPLVPPGAKTLMTNSAKYAHYGPGILGVDAVFGSTEACIDSAVVGRVVADDGPWAR
ncbi:MAG: aconitase X catalytic domain-containing protein [Chloroflexia bacterium]|nr:aconitase X catalytic domain-containing protein [Chloroflexia bacterium]